MYLLSLSSTLNLYNLLDLPQETARCRFVLILSLNIPWPKTIIMASLRQTARSLFQTLSQIPELQSAMVILIGSIAVSQYLHGVNPKVRGPSSLSASVRLQY